MVKSRGVSELPNYELKCAGCDNEFRIFASMSEKADKRIQCPLCGSNELETVYNTPPAYVKGAAKFECPNIRACGGCRHAG